LDGAREDVHAAHRDHVVDATGDSADELYERTPAGAAFPHRAHAVAGPVTDHRHAPSAEVRHDELALALLARGARDGIENFDDELGLVDVHAVARGAREAVRADLGRPRVVERRHPELALDALARRRD